LLIITRLVFHGVPGATAQYQVRCPSLTPWRVGLSGYRAERHIPGSQSAWGLCNQQHTARGSSQWAAGPCSGHSHWHRWCQSLSGKRQGEGWAGSGHRLSPASPYREFLAPGKLPPACYLTPPMSPVVHLPCLLSPPTLWASFRLTDLTVCRTFSPAMVVFTRVGTGWAWGQRKAVRGGWQQGE
jgi:hypothetical protein